MSGLSKVTLGTVEATKSVSFDESVCGMLFDCSMRSDVYGDYQVIYQNFGEGQVRLIHNMDEAAVMGLTDNNFLSGVPYYHLSKFFEYVGGNAELYVAFESCGTLNSYDFEVIQNMQMAAGGKIFQIGVWTEKSLWKKDDDGNVVFTELVSSIQEQALMGNGSLSGQGNETMPISIVLNANTVSYGNEYKTIHTTNYKTLPDAIELDCDKVSIVLGQESSDAVHAIQKTNANFTPVGLLGFAMGCLCLASAENSMGSVNDFDLNKDENLVNVELGFGLVGTGVSIPNYTPISDINRVNKNILAQNGYIFPVSYKAKEASWYFCNDQTCADNDYHCISNNRVISKCRRIIRYILLPSIKSNVLINTSTGKISDTSQAIFQNKIISALDTYLVNKLGQSQVEGRSVTVSSDDNILETDSLNIKCSFVPSGSADLINFLDSYHVND